MIGGITSVALLALAALLIYRRIAPHLRFSRDAIEAKINALLPQTQCGLCGFRGCRPYAAAIASGDADINRCPPGGELGVIKLANLLRVAPKPLDLSRGLTKTATLACIEESVCIGCTLCINACPVDAIIGAAKQMHTVLRNACTGCELCIPPCPVDCIRMEPLLGGAH